MNTSGNETRSGPVSRALELIQAVAYRDADPKEIAGPESFLSYKRSF